MVEVIAEIGKNFVVTEDPEPLEVLLGRAKQLIYEAKLAGADTVKFQVHNVHDEMDPKVHISAPHFNYDRYRWVARNTYPLWFWEALRDYCAEGRISFLATPMSRGAAELLDEVGVDRWKIGSGDILDFVLLDYVRDSGKPVILSSGMSSLEELRKAYDYLAEKVQDITILHCVSEYPCPVEHLNLNTIPFLKKEFPKARVGFSDHSEEIGIAESAVDLGAQVIEKHLTLDKDAWGPDHKASLSPDNMARMVFCVRSSKSIYTDAKILGVETKFLRPEEEGFRPVFRKGLYASRPIRKGEIIETDAICALRPKLPGARPSEEYPLVLGTVAARDYATFEPI